MMPFSGGDGLPYNCGVKSGAFLRMTAYFTVFFYILQRFIRRNEGDTRLNDAVFWRGWLAIQLRRKKRRFFAHDGVFYGVFLHFTAFYTA